MKRLAWTGVCAAVLVGGCGSLLNRPIAMEMTMSEGHWRFEGVQKATLEMGDWQIRIVESRVATAPEVPVLEKLVLEIANTSPSLPLTIEPGEVTLSGIVEPVVLGPSKTVHLGPAESHVIRYGPGLSAKTTAYPFRVRVTVFRGTHSRQAQTANLLLY